MFALLIPIKGLCAEGPNKEDPNKEKLGGDKQSGINLSGITLSDQDEKLVKKHAARMKKSGSAGSANSKSRVFLPLVEMLSEDESGMYNGQGIGGLPTFRYDGRLSASENLRNIKHMLFALKPGERLAIEGLNPDNSSSQEEFVNLVKKVPGIGFNFRLFGMGIAVFNKK